MRQTSLFIIIIFVSLFLLSACSSNRWLPKNSPNTANEITAQTPAIEPTEQQLNLPLSQALSRVTKKPFGIKITPLDSPVQPEKFSGYHTGVDFETLPEETESTIIVYAICEGPLVSKQTVSGYGGVAVQQCIINDSEVTVIYGHLAVNSITTKIKQSLTIGQPLGQLGQGFSPQTDQERKHLHLGIHQGTTINLRGYVQTEAELNSWLDPLPYLATLTSPIPTVKTK